MAKIVWKAATLLSPVPPVMVSCGTMEKPNVLTIAWTGIINSHPAMTYISVRPQRHSHHIIEKSGEFIINLTTEKLVAAADFCGVRSGASVDKFAQMKLTPEPASLLAAPMIAQSPMNLECRVKDVIRLGSHDMFLSEIVAVNVDEDVIGKTGRLNLHKCGLVAYVHGSYFALGKQLGTFGFSVKKKKKKSK